MKSFVFVACLLMASFAACMADDGEAKIVLIKDILNDMITEGHDLSVEYKLFNIGESTATDVQLSDSNFHDSDFELVSGMTSVTWDRIPAGSNVSHVVVVKPLKSAGFNFTSATVNYVAAEGSDPTFGMSNELGELNILSLKEYKRVHASHMMEWALFGVWSFPSIMLPYFLYYQSKSKYTVKAKST